MKQKQEEHLTVRGIPKELWHRVKVAATIRGILIGKWVKEALEEKLKGEEKR